MTKRFQKLKMLVAVVLIVSFFALILGNGAFVHGDSCMQTPGCAVSFSHQLINDFAFNATALLLFILLLALPISELLVETAKFQPVPIAPPPRGY